MKLSLDRLKPVPGVSERVRVVENSVSSVSGRVRVAENSVSGVSKEAQAVKKAVLVGSNEFRIASTVERLKPNPFQKNSKLCLWLGNATWFPSLSEREIFIAVGGVSHFKLG